MAEVGQKHKKEREKERAKVGNNNGQLRIAKATSCGARKAAWANLDWESVDSSPGLSLIYLSYSQK